MQNAIGAVRITKRESNLVHRQCATIRRITMTVVVGSLWSALVPALGLAQTVAGVNSLKPLARAVDLNVGESTEVVLSNGGMSSVKLLELNESRDAVCFAVRTAKVIVEIDGQKLELISGNYQLPKALGGVQADCPITKGYNQNGDPTFWGLDKDARIRLWPAGSPLIEPGTFIYPAEQKWFASNTQMANEPVYVDGGEKPGKRSIYYHSGLDIGGSEGLVPVVAATDALVVSVGTQVLDGHKQGTPVSERYDVVYLLDGRGWYYRYSHFKEIDKSVMLGRVLKMGDKLGVLGKEGGSGGWSHLHFEIKSKQPSGKWGTEEGYAYLWEAYQRQAKPSIIAVARPHQLAQVGDTVTLDASKSWCKSGQAMRFAWQFGDGSTASEAIVRRTYSKPGKFSEVVRVTDDAGNVSFDFANVYVFDPANPTAQLPSIHANYYPTNGIRVGDEVTFKVRSFGNRHGKEIWDFGDGSPRVEAQSDGNLVSLAPDGYAVTQHRFSKPGDYLVGVHRINEYLIRAETHLHVHVEGESSVSLPNQMIRENAWKALAPYFTPPDHLGNATKDYRSPLKFEDGRIVKTKEEWIARRQEIHRFWSESLGQWPPLITQPKVEILESTRRDNIQQIKIRFLWTPTEQTVGYLLIPEGSGRRPAVVTVYYEPETAIGLKGEDRDFALQLAKRGFVALSIGTTEATEAKTFALYYP
ncbi:MAG: PKD domain-containing protein, partial [Pirellula sp.]